ncbi:sensor histidine kinase [Agromyces sp. MMS24-JH15]|uniref:sensor histidine kinase n=1 Tax=Agromyces sp. MMS24-JH15 TaxID=3243765 RepID=UPI0037490674
MARVAGIVGVAGALLILVVPAASDLTVRVVSITLLLLTGGAVVLATRTGALWAAIAVVVLAMAAIAVIAPTSTIDPLATTTAVLLGGTAASSSAIPLMARPGGPGIVAVLLTAIVVEFGILAATGRATVFAVVAVAAGWFASAALGRWVDLAIARTSERIEEVGRAHRAERLASESEARQRQDARVLHDTVLATLSLLAHSGVGVGVGALRQQAGDDARMLRLLRLGAPLDSGHGAIFSPGAEADGGLSATFESVRKRFARMGLDVNWHGTGHLAMPRESIDALIGALAECLENVRRHSGVNEADVTITDDDRTVRAMVSDTGFGFEPDSVDPARLGFAESVVGRLRAVGGRARVFSSPGAGTTVMLEVPKP